MPSKARLLRELFESKDILRIVGAHNGLGAKLIERNRFDGIWASGLEISTSHAVPDANILTMTEALQAAAAMNEATSLPVVCDCDTGYGNASNVIHMVKKYEAAGIAAVVIEDKCFPKVNSFVPGRQDLASIHEFCGKLEAARSAKKNKDFMVFARVEALIAGWGMEEALKRAKAYAAAGADGIVIHSKSVTPDEVYTFAEKWQGSIPLVVIPTTYYDVPAEEFARRGFKMVIYANQGLRASIKAMDETFKSIYETGSTKNVEKKITTMKEVFDLQGMFAMKEEEKKYDKSERIQAVIPAAGKHSTKTPLAKLLKDKPLCMLDVGGKTLLERQAATLRAAGVNDICVVGGYQADKIRLDGAQLLHNEAFASTNIAYSFMQAKNHFKSKCLMVYSDIFFDQRIINHLLSSPHAVTLVIDRAYQDQPRRDKELDLVAVKNSGIPEKNGRRLQLNTFKSVERIGKNIDRNRASYEFIGLAFFQGEGVKQLQSAWDKACKKFQDKKFYEAASAQTADFNDLIQYMIDEKVPVYGMEIEHGWSEVHSMDDYERVKSHFAKPVKVGVPS